MKIRLVLIFVMAIALAAQPRYDLLLKGGYVIDPKNHVSRRQDVVIRDGKIATITGAIPTVEARKVVNVRELWITPGLVDIHAHVFAGENGGMLAGGTTSIFPDNFAFKAGVTTVVDAGSSGRRNYAQLKKNVIDRARTRVLVFLNILGAGMPGDNDEQDLNDMDAKASAALAIANKETIIGIKVDGMRRLARLRQR